jgi:hypothetical protein
MKKLIKLPIAIIGFILLVPIDFIRLILDEDPIGIDLIEWSQD